MEVFELFLTISRDIHLFSGLLPNWGDNCTCRRDECQAVISHICDSSCKVKNSKDGAIYI